MSSLDVAVREWRSGKLDSAESTLTSLLIDLPTWKEALGVRSSVLSMMGRKEESLRDAMECLRLDEEWYKAYGYVGLALSSLGRRGEAIKYVEKGLEKNPHSKALASERERYLAEMEAEAGVEVEVEAEVSGMSENSLQWMKSRGLKEERVVPLPLEKRRLIRHYVESKLKWKRELTSTPEKLLDEVHFLLRLLHRMQDLMHEDVRVRRAMADMCECLSCTLESFAIQEKYDMGDKYDQDDRLSLEICFFPPKITLHSASPHVEHRTEYIRVSPVQEEVVDYIQVFPVKTLLLEERVARGALGLLVFRLPKKCVVQVDVESWMGMSKDSCIFCISRMSNKDDLIRIAHRLTEGFGAMWVWVYASEDHFDPRVKAVRDSSSKCVLLRKGSSMRLFRIGFEWNISVESGKA